jgi:hypothetical protein
MRKLRKNSKDRPWRRSMLSRVRDKSKLFFLHFHFSLGNSWDFLPPPLMMHTQMEFSQMVSLFWIWYACHQVRSCVLGYKENYPRWDIKNQGKISSPFLLYVFMLHKNYSMHFFLYLMKISNNGVNESNFYVWASSVVNIVG